MSTPSRQLAAVRWRDHFTFRPEYLGWLREGRKSTTIRCQPGALELPAAVVLPVTGGGSVRIRSLAIRRYEDLGEDDARRDGFASLAEMGEALTGFYPAMALDDWVTVYEIGLLP